MRAHAVVDEAHPVVRPVRAPRSTGLLALQRCAGNRAVGALLRGAAVQRMKAADVVVGRSYTYVHSDGRSYTAALTRATRNGWYHFDNGHQVRSADNLTPAGRSGKRRAEGQPADRSRSDKRRRVEESEEESEAESEEQSEQSEESEESEDERSSSEDERELDVADRYPRIFNILRRPGHYNPYRSGLGAADTTAALVRDQQLLARDTTVDDAELGRLEDRIARHDQALKLVNDDKEVALLTRLAALAAKQGELLDTDEPDKEEAEQLAKRVRTREEKLDDVRKGKRADLNALRKIFRKVLWLSEKDFTDYDRKTRKEQVAKFLELERDKTFGASYRAAEDSELDYWDAEEGEHPSWTCHHSEQRLIVSKRWLDQLAEIRREVRELVGRARGRKALEAVARGLDERTLRIVLNRSSCPMCNAFLVAELLRFWGVLAKETGCGREDVQEELAGRKLHFEITYSVVYGESAKIIDTLNAQLAAAGWQVAQHETTVGSPAEIAHERLTQGRPSSRAEADEGEEARTKRGRKPKEEDEDYAPPGERRKGKRKVGK